MEEENFKDTLKFNPEHSEYSEKFKHFEKPPLFDIVDGYFKYVSYLGESFLKIVEQYYSIIEIAKNNELIGDTTLKARIKDFSSAYANSDDKTLNDMYGMEIAAATEREKEILMLFNHLTFLNQNDKKYNKKSGYVAYHSIEDFIHKTKNYSEHEIKEIIAKTTTFEISENVFDIKNFNRKKVNKRKLNRKKVNKRKLNGKKFNIRKYKRRKVDVFPVLKEEIKDETKLKEITRVLAKMTKQFQSIKLEKEKIPMVEFHFMTKQVAEESIRGKASHAKYKPVNEEMIKKYFSNGALLRGINAPWKFKSTEQGIKLQDFYETLIENWPFLKELIVKKRNQGKDDEYKSKIELCDMLTACQLDFLRKYLPDRKYNEEKKEEYYGALKALILACKIDMNSKANPIGNIINSI